MSNRKRKPAHLADIIKGARRIETRVAADKIKKGDLLSYDERGRVVRHSATPYRGRSGTVRVDDPERPSRKPKKLRCIVKIVRPKPCKPCKPKKPSKQQLAIEKLLKIIFGKSCSTRCDNLRLAISKIVTQPKPQKKETQMEKTTFTTAQQQLVTLEIRTDNGKPAKIDGPISWEVLEGTSAYVLSSESGKVAKLIANDEAGVTTFRASADADLGEGVEPITLDIEVTVTEVKASQIGGVFGAITDKEEDPQPPTDV